MRRRQPLRKYMDRDRWSVTTVAARAGVERGHLVAVIGGAASPNEELRDQLPRILNVPLADLFDAELLARPWSGPRGREGGRRKDGGAR